MDAVWDTEEWADPFAHPLTSENREFIRDYGKWSAFDISHLVPASFFLGRTLTAFQEIRDEMDEVKEAVLEFGEFVIKAYSYGGEIRVEWNGPDFSLCDIPSLLPPEWYVVALSLAEISQLVCLLGAY